MNENDVTLLNDLERLRISTEKKRNELERLKEELDIAEDTLSVALDAIDDARHRLFVLLEEYEKELLDRARTADALYDLMANATPPSVGTLVSWDDGADFEVEVVF